jgi:hypothetical protein
MAFLPSVTDGLCHCIEDEISRNLRTLEAVVNKELSVLDRLIRQAKAMQRRGLGVDKINEVLEEFQRIENDLDSLLRSGLDFTGNLPFGQLLECFASTLLEEIDNALSNTGIPDLLGDVVGYIRDWLNLLTNPRLPSICIRLDKALSAATNFCDLDRSEFDALADEFFSKLGSSISTCGVPNPSYLTSLIPIETEWQEAFTEVMTLSQCNNAKYNELLGRVNQVEQDLFAIDLGQGSRPTPDQSKPPLCEFFDTFVTTSAPDLSPPGSTAPKFAAPTSITVTQTTVVIVPGSSPFVSFPTPSSPPVSGPSTKLCKVLKCYDFPQTSSPPFSTTVT